MIMKLIYDKCEEIQQIQGFHVECGKMGDKDFYMEIYYPKYVDESGEMAQPTITVDNKESADPECMFDVTFADIEKGDKCHLAIYTDSMTEIYTIYKNF